MNKCDQCDAPATWFRTTKTSGYNAPIVDWEMSLCDKHAPNAPLTSSRDPQPSESALQSENSALSARLNKAEEDSKRLNALLEIIPAKHSFGGAGEAYGLLTNIVIQAKNIRELRGLSIAGERSPSASELSQEIPPSPDTAASIEKKESANAKTPSTRDE